MALENLFTPFDSEKLHLKNRFVMAPMTRTASPHGIPTQAVADYYARRSDLGLIITEGTVVERPASKNERDIPNFYGDALPAWKTVVEAVHAKGGKIAPQIWHTGAAKGRDPSYAPTPMDTPSGLAKPGKVIAEPMTDADIADTIAAFAKSAAAAKDLGFDALELHGAHGYLIDNFFWDGTNTRTDIWGGATIKERSRFGAEVVKAVRAAVGEAFPVILRLSQWKQQDYEARLAKTPDEMSDWLGTLSDAGVDIFHCSQRRFWEPEFDGSDLNFAGWAKKLTGKPAITVGSVGLTGEFIAAFGGESSKPASLEGLVKKFRAGEFDLVAVGRAVLNDSEWLAKVKDGRFTDLKDFSPAALATLA